MKTHVSKRQKMAARFPTAESLEKERIRYKSWADFARANAISEGTIYDYRRELKMQCVGKQEILKQFVFLTDRELDERIAEFFGGQSKNTVAIYKIDEPEVFYQNQLGYDGLTFDRIQHGASWRDIRKQTPSMINY